MSASLLVAALAACDSGPTQPMPSRVDAVAATAPAEVDLDAFCEERPEASAAPTFPWPVMRTPAPAPTASWRWVNVWATWCAPCIEELPRISTWPGKLDKEGLDLELVLLSVDEDAAKLQAMKRKLPETADSLHMTEADKASEWMGSLGVEVNESLPLHIFLDPAGRIRCVRSGAVERDALRSIEALIRAG